MKSFSAYQQLNEAAGKNLHLEHLEDELLNEGIKGGRAAINFLRSLRDMLKGDAKSAVNVTVKWDGAPAVFFGIDPEDGQFFVAKKGIFNKNPKVYKSHADIDADTSGDLSTKLKYSFDYLQKLDLGGNVYQGDLMFTANDLKSENIDGESLITFQPNTIVYAVPVNSELGAEIKKAKMGIVIHTKYSGGPTLQDMSASFNIDVSGMGKVSGLWYQDASYRDVSGNATFTSKELTEMDVVLSKLGKAFQQINSKEFAEILKMQDQLTGGLVGASLKTFINSQIRNQTYINPASASKEYTKYLVDYFNEKQIAKVKTEKAKTQKAQMRDEYVRLTQKYSKTLSAMFAFYSLINEAKILIVRKLESVKQMTRTFNRTDRGFEVTEPEGFVAVDKVDGKAVKLVDRLTFSYNNFTAAKNWTK
jgi:hypothetical protein